MSSEILSVVIDERKNPENIDSQSLLNMGHRFGLMMSSSRKVFKDYLLSSDPYYLDPTLE